MNKTIQLLAAASLLLTLPQCLWKRRRPKSAFGFNQQNLAPRSLSGRGLCAA